MKRNQVFALGVLRDSAYNGLPLLPFELHIRERDAASGQGGINLSEMPDAPSDSSTVP